MGFCRNCGAEIDDNAAMCVKCGFKKGTGTGFCQHCGKPTNEGQSVCTSCGYSLKGTQGGIAKKGTGEFTRSSDGKIFGGVFSGLEKSYGINRWIGRLVMLFVPFWIIWLIAYIVVCVKFPLE